METMQLGVTPLNGNEMVMRDMGYRYARGATLTFAEEGMAMVATAAMTANNYGPGPATMKLQRPALPENVKGALAQYSA